MIKRIRKIKNGLSGEIFIPSDKSISHRAAIFASLAHGKSIIKNFSKGKDPHSTLNVIEALGIEIEKLSETEITISSKGEFKTPQKDLFCGNSGTTMRLMAGAIAAKSCNAILTGDLSLSKRPMKRIITPLEMMGAKIKSNNYSAPIEIFSSRLTAINYDSPISSAQVKSCILLAGLNTEGKTTIKEPFLSRNHTEIMLKYMGADISTNNTTVSIKNSKLSPINITICGDISSAAYFIVAALIIPNSDIIIKNVGLNPTRTGIIDIIKNMCGDIEILDKKTICDEFVGDIRVKYSPNLKATNIDGEIIPRLIDEIPIIALLATQANGTTIIKDAQDLRHKESDRISTVVNSLKKLGAKIEETNDGMIIEGKTKLNGDCCLTSFHDHRLAMTFYCAGQISEKEIAIEGFEWVNISFPEFEQMFEKLTKY